MARTGKRSSEETATAPSSPVTNTCWKAAAENEQGPVGLVSCSPARTGSATAQFSAEYLINEAEMDIDIHTAKSLLILPVNESTGWSWLGCEALFDRVGRAQPTFESYWGHHGRPDVPTSREAIDDLGGSTRDVQNIDSGGIP
jgi:hypothetical protein